LTVTFSNFLTVTFFLFFFCFSFVEFFVVWALPTFEEFDVGRKQKKNKSSYSLTSCFSYSLAVEKIGRATYLEIKATHGEIHRAHFLKGVFSAEDLAVFRTKMLASQSWSKRKCKRRVRQAMYKGHWAAQGHFDPEQDKEYIAGTKFHQKKDHKSPPPNQRRNVGRRLDGN
jgi:hypothetical protein